MGKTILIVEDEPKNMTLTRDLLKISGYETIEARDGKEGVEKAKSSETESYPDGYHDAQDGWLCCLH